MRASGLGFRIKVDTKKEGLVGLGLKFSYRLGSKFKLPEPREKAAHVAPVLWGVQRVVSSRAAFGVEF